MKAALDTRALVRAGVILVVVALAVTLYSAFIGGAESDSGRAISAAGATTSDKVSLLLIPKEFTIGLPLIVAAIFAVMIAGGSG